MGRIEADIALESWLFGFQPCSALFGTGAVYPFFLFLILVPMFPWADSRDQNLH